jgi:prolipoprotein diacylglyceryltransferase
LHIGSFEVTTFGTMVAVGALAGLWLFERDLRRSGLSQDALNGAALGVLAGLVGAKLLFVFEHRAEEPLTSLLTTRAGLSWFGGLFGGVGAALAYFRWRLLLRWRREKVADELVLGRYFVLAGLARFLIEFVRVNVRVALGLTVAQYGALTIAAAGALLIASAAARVTR